MTDRQLHGTALSFRRGILNGRPSSRMCFAVCAPLQGYLSVVGYKTELVQGEIEDEGGCYSHYWLRLPDGRIIDPTADQFKTPKGKPMPQVYVGERPHWYRLCKEAKAA